MSDESVFQLQTLNGIVRSQVDDYAPRDMAVFGVTTGNGLEHTESCDIVYAIDINDDYLAICRKRFHTRGNIRYLNLDIDSEALPFETIDMAICNLVLEYIDVGHFMEAIGSKLDDGGILSAVFQNDLPDGFVSRTQYSNSFKGLNSIYHSIDENDVLDIADRNGLEEIATLRYNLKNGKVFTRIDFKKTGNTPV